MAHSSLQDQMITGALDAARRGDIIVRPCDERLQYSLYWKGGSEPIPIPPLPPIIFLGPMPLIDFGRWVENLIHENDVQAKKIKELEQTIYLAGRALANAGSAR